MNHSVARTAVHINLRTLNIWLGIAVLIAAIGYFLTINDLSIKGFVFKDLKSQYNDLAAERQSMEHEITKLASYQNLASRIQSQQLVAADTIHYISWEAGMVAKK